VDEVDVPWTLLVLGLPVAVAVAVRHRRGDTLRAALASVGVRGCAPGWFLWAFGGVAAGLMLAAVVLQVVPADALGDHRLAAAAYQGMRLTLGTTLLVLWREAVYVALGEELFFRGLLGGWLVDRLGFSLGNTLQAVLFLVPDLALLRVSPVLWVLIAAQFVIGWLLGWLRHESGSILPGWVAHTLAGATAALVISF
jgi:membrane protease YdiL (CAAX protease family)